MTLLNRLCTNTFIKASGINTFVNFLLKGMMLLTVPIFTKLLSPDIYGNVAAFNTYTSFFVIFIGMNTKASVTNAKFDFGDKFQNYLSSITLLTLILTFSAYILILINTDKVTVFLKIEPDALQLLLVVSFCQYMISMMMAINIIENKYLENLLISSITGVGGLIASIILIKYFMSDNKYIARIIGQYIFTIPFAAYLLVRLIIKGKEFVNVRYWGYALRISIPNIFHVIGQIVLTQFDRIQILRIVNNSAVGIYSLAYNFGMIIQILWASINAIWTPWLFRKLQNNQTQTIVVISKLYINMMSIITVLVVGVSPDIVRLLTPIEYWEATRITTPLILSGYLIFLYSIPAGLEFYHKRHLWIGFASTLAAVINICLNILFIPIFGYEAAAWTTLISYLVLVLFHYFASNLLKINIYKFYHLWVPGILTLLGSLILSFFDDKSILIKYILAIILVAANSVVFYKKYGQIIKNILNNSH